MAKILAPYALCPLAERKRFVGISPDSESGCVIVTLARNIIIRYRMIPDDAINLPIVAPLSYRDWWHLSNQKQVSSWSTKAMLSAPVIYDHASKLYYGIFNSDEVSSWEEHVVSLGKLSKVKFIWLIHSIVSSEDVPAVIVYQNGVISPLKTDLAHCKEPPDVKEDQLLPPEETIKEARLVSLSSVHYVALSTTTEAGEKFFHLVPVDQDRGTRSFVKLERDDFKLTAFTILDGESPVLISLWSDGKLFSLSLPTKDAFPGKLISTVKCIDVNHPAVILQLGQEHFVLYGAAPNSEGAYLVILGRQFGLPESVVKMKVYDDESRMWTSRNNIVMVLGGHLIVAPFRLDTVKLASLIGVDKIGVDINKDSSTSILDNSAEGIAARVSQMKEEGHIETFICDTIFSELLEAKNTEGLLAAIDNITDIPDKWLIQAVNYAVEDVTTLKKLLKLPLSGDASAQTLVRQKLMLSSVLKVVAVITEMLREDDVDKCILDWACLLCDTHYLQCLLSKDEQVISAIRDLRDAIEEHIESMVTYRSLLAEINYFKRGKVTSNTQTVSSHSYAVEKIKLY